MDFYLFREYTNATFPAYGFQSPDEDSLDFYGHAPGADETRLPKFQSPDEDSLDFYGYGHYAGSYTVSNV